MRPSASTTVFSADNLAQQTIDKLADLECLQEISLLIDRLYNSGEDRAKILGEISGVAKRIKFKDASANYVRNKYGSIDRNKNSVVREGGLEINYLSFLGDLGLEDKVDVWHGDLRVIQQKIALIFAAEKDPVTKSSADVLSDFKTMPPPLDFIKDVKRAHIAKISEKIIYVLRDERLSALNFNSRQDRYYFGNILLKIGELSRELIDFANPNQESGLFSFFKKIRNNLAHNPDSMTADLDVTQISNLSEIKNIMMTEFALEANNIRFDGSLIGLNILTEDQKTLNHNLLSSVFGGVTAKKKKTDIIDNLARSITEIEYLQWVIDHPAIDPKKKDYILEFGVTKIAHCLNVVNNDPTLAKYSKGAKVLQKSWLDTIRTRNEKIAHGIMDFDRDDIYHLNFSKIVTSMRDDLKNLSNILNYLSSTTIGQLESLSPYNFLDVLYLIQVAVSFDILGLKDESREILTKCLQSYEKEPALIAVSKERPLSLMIKDKGFLECFKISDFGQMSDVLNDFCSQLYDNSRYRENIERGATIIQAAIALPDEEKQNMFFMLSIPYYLLQHQVIKHSYREDSSSGKFINQLYAIEERIFGEALRETRVAKGFLLQERGNVEQSRKEFESAAKTISGDRINQVESLFYLSKSYSDNGEIEQARKYLKQAEKVANSQPICNHSKLLVLGKIAVFEASKGGDIRKADKYFNEAFLLFKAYEGDLRKLGNVYIDVKRVFLEETIDFIEAKYSPSRNSQRRILRGDEVEQINNVYELVKSFQSQNNGKWATRWQKNLISIYMAFNAAALISLNGNEIQNSFLDKAKDLEKIFDSDSVPNSSKVKQAGDVIEIRIILGEIEKGLEEGKKEEILSDLNGIFYKLMASKNDFNDFDDINKVNAKYAANFFFRIISSDDDAQSFEFLSKSFALKELYGIEKTRDEMFLMSRIQSELKGEDEHKHMKESILRLEEAKKMPKSATGYFNDDDIYNLLGELYYLSGDFRESIQNYQFVLHNSTDDEQKAKASGCMKDSFDAMRQFQPLENALLSSYKITRKSVNYLTIPTQSIIKEEMSDYLREVLRIKNPKVNYSVGGGLRVTITDDLKEVLDKRLSDKQKIGGRS